MSKHHCRACGRIVCHSCSPRTVFFELTKKFERVCNECLKGDSIAEQRRLERSFSATEAMKENGQNVVETNLENLEADLEGSDAESMDADDEEAEQTQSK